MKKNTVLCIGTILFVILFYRQEVALNLSIFCLLVEGMIVGITPKKNHTRHFWLLSGALFISVAGFAWYGDFPSFIALFLTLLFFIIKAFYPKLNVLAFPFVVLISGATAPIRILFVKKWLKLQQKFSSDIGKKVLAFVVAPLFFTIIFVALYSAVSNRFAAYLHFNWNFENLAIVFLLSMLGFFLMFNFVHLYIPRMLTKENFRLKENFSLENQHQFLKKLSINNNSYFVRKSGEITLIILNLVLLFFIFVYATESLQNTHPEVSYSSEVHERVYVLIASIVVAVAIIMIYFQSRSNFEKSGKFLRIAAYVWITLNAVLVVIAMFKNGEYVHYYGLTFKRIGVYIFLLLAIIGLVMTVFKLVLVKTNVYLLNRMAWIFFVTIVMGVNINWSWLVTKYNITYQEKPDMYYLLSLDYNKQLMYETFGDSWLKENPYDETIVREVRQKKKKEFLSKNLYYEFLDIK
jgi:hypothetical protein